MRRFTTPMLAALLSLCVFLPGLTWGLPSRDVDRFLFGDRTPWAGDEILALTGEFDAGEGSADADTMAADDNEWLNDTDRERAEIVARYRLYSYQPDEMLTFRALATAAANRGDPQFYTYGGLWVYPVGILIKAAQIVGLVGDGGQAYYLDHPEEFAKFYVIARLYAVAWAAIGAVVVCVLVRRVTRSNALGVLAAVTYAFLPVVVVAAHEAKPHLPGAVLALWAVLPADTFVRTGRRRSLLWSGVICGLATGMVVTMAVSFLVLPAAALLRWSRTRRKLKVAAEPAPRVERQPASDTRSRLRGYFFAIIAAAALGVLAFAFTNPYLVLNLLTNPTAVAGNAGQTAGHYQLGLGGTATATQLLARAVSPEVLSGFLCFLIFLPTARFYIGPFSLRRLNIWRSGGLLLAWSAMSFALLAFWLTAGGRPADHVRFAVLPSIGIVIVTIVIPHALIAGVVPGRSIRLIVPASVGFAATVSGVPVVAGFASDASASPSRQRAAEQLQATLSSESAALRLWADPAPAFIPPFDLWRSKATVVDPAEADVRMMAESTASISWADRRFEIVHNEARP